MHVDVDLLRCEGNGLCAVQAPEVFDLDDNDQLTVLDSQPDATLHDAVEAAARACPKQAISLGP